MQFLLAVLLVVVSIANTFAFNHDALYSQLSLKIDFDLTNLQTFIKEHPQVSESFASVKKNVLSLVASGECTNKKYLDIINPFYASADGQIPNFTTMFTNFASKEKFAPMGTISPTATIASWNLLYYSYWRVALTLNQKEAQQDIAAANYKIRLELEGANDYEKIVAMTKETYKQVMTYPGFEAKFKSLTTQLLSRGTTVFMVGMPNPSDIVPNAYDLPGLVYVATPPGAVVPSPVTNPDVPTATSKPDGDVPSASTPTDVPSATKPGAGTTNSTKSADNDVTNTEDAELSAIHAEMDEASGSTDTDAIVHKKTKSVPGTSSQKSKSNSSKSEEVASPDTSATNTTIINHASTISASTIIGTSIAVSMLFIF